jgi:hypothetical protein
MLFLSVKHSEGSLRNASWQDFSGYGPSAQGPLLLLLVTFSSHWECLKHTALGYAQGFAHIAPSP